MSSKQKKEIKLTTTQWIFTELCRQELGLEPVPEYKFYPGRQWRADYFFCLPGGWPALILEVEGGIKEGAERGRHMRADGFKQDMEKYNAAATLGMPLLRCTPAKLKTIHMVQSIRQTLLAQFWLGARRLGLCREQSWACCPGCGLRFDFPPGDKKQLPAVCAFLYHAVHCNYNPEAKLWPEYPAAPASGKELVIKTTTQLELEERNRVLFHQK